MARILAAANAENSFVSHLARHLREIRSNCPKKNHGQKTSNGKRPRPAADGPPAQRGRGFFCSIASRDQKARRGGRQLEAERCVCPPFFFRWRVLKHPGAAPTTLTASFKNMGCSPGIRALFSLSFSSSHFPTGGAGNKKHDESTLWAAAPRRSFSRNQMPRGGGWGGLGGVERKKSTRRTAKRQTSARPITRAPKVRLPSGLAAVHHPVTVRD